MFRKKIGFAAMIMAVLGLLITATQVTTAAPQLQAAAIVNIGVLGPLDSSLMQGVALAVTQINGNGGIALVDGSKVNLSVLAADPKSPAEVQQAVDKLKQNKVVALFGPADPALAAQSASILAGAKLPVFITATSTAIKVGGTLFRARTADNVQMPALAEVLTKDLNKTKIAVYQGSADYSSQVSEFVIALAKRSISPTTTVLQVENSPLTDSIKVLTDSQPDTITAFGTPTQIAELYRTLRSGNFVGTFASPVSTSPDFMKSIVPALRKDIYGVDAWSYASGSNASIDFIRGYLKLTGQVPNSDAASAFDAANLLAIAIGQAGIDPDAIAAKIPAIPAFDGVQGSINPALGNGELSANVFVTISGPYGGSTTLARFSGAQRLSADDSNTVTPTVTASPTPTAPLVPVQATATPAGVVGTVTGNTLNVRSGPGTVYPVIGTLKKNEQVQLIGADQQFNWYVISYRGQQGWISASLVSVFGDRQTLPIIQPPPTPTPLPATATPTQQPFADLIMVSAQLNPVIPAPGQQFTLAVTLRNQGSVDAGPFAVATSFKPGEVYSAVNIPGLGAGQQTVVNLSATVAGTTIDTIAIVIDLNNQVNEGPTGKTNNKPTFSYKIDRPYQATGNITLNPGQGYDFDGGGDDLVFTGNSLHPTANSALLATGLQLTQIHRDLLASQLGPVANNNNVVNNVPVGAIVAIRTTAGRFGFVRVTGYSGGGPSINLEYYIYQ